MTFEKESVGSNSVSTHSPISGLCSPSNTNSDESTPRNRRRFPRVEDMATCFNCQKLGHWVRDCPRISPRRPPPPSSGVPVFHCPCGAGPCSVVVSNSEKNPHRKYYRCHRYYVEKCDFFEWCDKVTSDVMIYTPSCRCGAGACRIYEETSGPDAGRRFFVCPIKKGQGACNFMKPLDDPNDLLDESMGSPESTLTYCHTTSPSGSDLVEEGDLSDRGMEIESPVAGTPAHPQELGASELSREESVSQVDFQGQEDISDEPLRKNYKRLRHGVPKIGGSILDAISDCEVMSQPMSEDPTVENALRASLLSSEALIHQRQAKFLRHISSAETSLPRASSTSSCYSFSALSTAGESLTQNCLQSAINQILDLPFEGWCGRLLFPPSRCLTVPAPKPFFCCVFPSFDPISNPQDANLPNAERQHSSSGILHNPSLPTRPGQSLAALLPVPSGLQPPPKTLQGNIMKQSILAASFRQAAACLQDGLLTRIESMDSHDHESVLEEAKSVFGALDRLLVDYKLFRGQVMELICHAASLSEVEMSIHNDGSAQELVDGYSRKKLLLEEISRYHSETSTALQSSDECLESLKKEVSHIKDTLSHKEVELSRCVNENQQIRTRFDQITENKLQSEVDLEAAFGKAEEALKLCQQREAERNIAKASFENAKSKLRQSCNIAFS